MDVIVTNKFNTNYTDSIVLAVDSACDTYQWNVDSQTYTTSALDTGFIQLYLIQQLLAVIVQFIKMYILDLEQQKLQIQPSVKFWLDS